MKETGLAKFSDAGKAELSEFKVGEKGEAAGKDHGQEYHDGCIVFTEEIPVSRIKEQEQQGSAAKYVDAGKASVCITEQIA
ncbi:MAG: hypothetical protein K2O13_00220 [Lachnospiraceae bacterium]|nr:hypothetical protein [Lachnospiraceae bacterium]